MCNDCTESKAHRKSGKWKDIQTVLLPGDHELFVEAEIARAQRRDSRLNPQEYRVLHEAYSCYWRIVKYESWHCSWRDPCPFCEDALR